MYAFISGPVEERRMGDSRNREKHTKKDTTDFVCLMHARVYDPAVNQPALGATRRLLSSRVPHAGAGWLMWLPWLGSSACNQAPACNHLLFLFICNFTEGQCCELQCWGRGGWVWRKRGGGYEEVLCHKHPLRFPSPVPRTIHFWQVPEAQTVNFIKLWVTLPDKSPSSQPPKLDGIFHRMPSLPMCRTIPWHNCRGNKCPFVPH